ncbi:DUF3693 domain-containing protein [Adlercreutzia sp. ZJ242]
MKKSRYGLSSLALKVCLIVSFMCPGRVRILSTI